MFSKCRTCSFFMLTATRGDGVCRRHPQYLDVFDTHTCGEHTYNDGVYFRRTYLPTTAQVRS